jgi:hypothetical protein
MFEELFLILLLNAAVTPSSIKIGIILMESAPEPFDMRRVGPAIDLALESARVNLGITLEPIKRNYSGVCPYEPPVGILSDLYHSENIKGILGPACSQGLLASARLAQYIKLPMVTGLGDLIVRRENVDMFKSLTILSYDLRKLSCKYTGLLNDYDADFYFVGLILKYMINIFLCVKNKPLTE